MLKKLWHDPVWSKVIAGLILAAIPAGTYYLNLWPFIWNSLLTAYHFLLISIPVPNWLLLALLLFCLPTVGIILALFWGQFISQKSKDSNWRAYKTDTFFGLRWRWGYDSIGEIHQLVVFCPNCDFQIYPQVPSDLDLFTGEVGTAFNCESCGTKFPTLPEPQHIIEDKVTRSIQQKIRNHAWPARGNS